MMGRKTVAEHKFIRERICRNSLFSNLEESQLRNFVEKSTLVTMPKNSILFDQGSRDIDASFFIVADGEINIYDISGDKKVLLKVLKRGDMLGEYAMLFNSKRPYAASAKTDAKLFSLTRSNFTNHVLDSPNIRKIFDFYSSVEINGKKYMSLKDLVKSSSPSNMYSTTTTTTTTATTTNYNDDDGNGERMDGVEIESENINFLQLTSLYNSFSNATHVDNINKVSVPFSSYSIVISELVPSIICLSSAIVKFPDKPTLLKPVISLC